jgi:hypothetical protein
MEEKSLKVLGDNIVYYCIDYITGINQNIFLSVQTISSVQI